MAEDLNKKEVDQKARKALIWFTSSSALWQAFSWVFTVYLARVLAPEDYGVMALAGAFHPYLLLLATLKLDLWYVQRSEVDKDVEKTAFTLVMALAVMVSVFCMLTASQVAVFMEDERVKDVFLVMAISFLLKGLSAVPEAKLKRELNFKPIALMNISVGFLRQVLTLVLAIEGYGYWALMIGQLFGDFLSTIWLNVASPIKFGFKFDRSLSREALKFGGLTAGGIIFWAGGTKIDDLLVGKMLGVEFLGFYSMAYMLAELPLSKMNAFMSSILLSYFSKLKDNREVLLKSYLDVTRGMSLIIVPGLFGMAIVAPELIPLMIGEKWTPIIPMFQVMCLIWSLLSCVGPVVRLLLAMGQAKLVFYLSAINFFILAVGFYLGLTVYGEKGLYYTWLIAYPLTTMVSAKFIQITTGLGVLRYIANFKITIVCVAAMALITWNFRVFMLEHLSSIPLLISTIVVGAVTFVAMLRIFFFEEALKVYKVIRHGNKGAEVPAEETVAVGD